MKVIDMTTITARMDLQNKEFETVDELAKQWKRLQLTPIVDDDYPEVRSGYEGALQRFLRAVNDNRLSKEGTAVKDELQAIVRDVLIELRTATTNWPAFNSAHEAHAVLEEEVEELWAHVKTNQKRRDLAAMRREAIQVAAMAMRFAFDVCDETRGRK